VAHNRLGPRIDVIDQWTVHLRFGTGRGFDATTGSSNLASRVIAIERLSDGEVLLARFTEQDIAVGRLVDPKSKLRMLITRPLASKRAR
jgi:hypothetical protein